MYNVILGLHIFVCFLLIIAVLLQRSKDSDIGAALGGGSGEMFGPRAPGTVMNKITTVIAACFLILSLTLAVLSGVGGKASVLRDEATRDATQPAQGGLVIEEKPATTTPPSSGGIMLQEIAPTQPDGSGK